MGVGARQAVHLDEQLRLHPTRALVLTLRCALSHNSLWSHITGGAFGYSHVRQARRGRWWRGRGDAPSRRGRAPASPSRRAIC